MKFLAAIIILALTSLSFAADAKRPNILFILADDLGLDGVSCYGSDIHPTPNIDALAKSGTRFETCYAAPLCGPSRCLFVTGRYAFHTGGLNNSSWDADGGKGPHAANEVSVAKTMKAAGYATGHSGKWRQVGDTPSAWGFDEYLTDRTAGGYYWEKVYAKNGETITSMAEQYMPNIEQDFTLDFLRRHKDQPFFFYYAMHLVHKPTVLTADNPTHIADNHETRHQDDPALYQTNIAYMDKQVGEVIAELEKLGLRDKTLVVFSGDNGTARGMHSPIHGRLINGEKGSMLEGGSRVPMIVSWPGVTPAGKVSTDIVSFADLHPTFAAIGGTAAPANVDGLSFAPQVRGETGKPRAWAYVQLGAQWFVREPGYKMNHAHELFDMSDAPFVEKPVDVAGQSPEAAAARARLTAVLAELNPAAGLSETGGKRDKTKKGKKKAAATE